MNDNNEPTTITREEKQAEHDDYMKDHFRIKIAEQRLTDTDASRAAKKAIAAAFDDAHGAYQQLCGNPVSVQDFAVCYHMSINFARFKTDECNSDIVAEMLQMSAK